MAKSRWIAAVAGALVLGSLLATPAAAHDALVASDPPDGAVLEVAPESIVLEFTGNILDLNPQMQVTDAAGETLEVGEAQIDGMFVTWELLDELAGGQYDVVWVVTSSDGHPIDGEFSFTSPVLAPEETPEPTDPEPTDTEPTDTPTAPDEPSATDTLTATEEDPADPVDLSENAEAWFIGGLAVTALVVVAIVVFMRRNRDPNGPPGQS